MNSSNQQVRVLLIDDDEDDYILIRHVFSRIPDLPFILEWCSSYSKAKKLINQRKHDIYLIDYNLGKFNGLDLLKFAEPEKRAEPFIMLTGMGDRETEHKSLKLAAADYLVKGTFGPELLSRTLLYSLGRKQVEQQRVAHLLELNQTKDEFISVASHQLRTPATGVKQYIGMLLEGYVGELTEAQLGILSKAYESNERQLRIVSDLLKVAQVDAGKVVLRKSETNVIVLIHDVIKEQSKTYENRRQTVNFVEPKTPIVTSIDKDRIRMVIENILDNASKYSDQGTAVGVAVTETSEEIVIAIQDKGVGIAQADIDKLFGKFSRIYNPLSTQVGGTGLGLYWAQKIVLLHGGKITVKSRENYGTTFTIHLPKHSEMDMLK